jgi:hypothetical protein
MKGGFRLESTATRAYLENIVGKEAMEFAKASFFGAMIGSMSGAVFCFGLGAIFF